ncbi:MAG: hypothetical protein ACYDCK_13275 [Thermoplasmatota archaeon]
MLVILVAIVAVANVVVILGPWSGPLGLPSYIGLGFSILVVATLSILSPWWYLGSK